MTNAFEQTDHDYLVLRNDEDQYSLWPAPFTPPEGWHTAFGPAHRDDCTTHIQRNWTDMRPRSLREPHTAPPASTPTTY